MNFQTRGIVLQTVKYSETSVIAKIFTERLGLVSYMVNGIRSTKSKNKAAMLQPLTLLELEVVHRENKNLQRIREFRREYVYQSIPFDVAKSSIALLMLEVVANSLREHDSNAELFEFVHESFQILDAEIFNPDFHLIFLVQLAGHLGFAPHEGYTEQHCFFNLREGSFSSQNDAPNYCLNKEESEVLYRLMTASLLHPVGDLNRIKRNALLTHLLNYFALHLEGFRALRSPEILEMLFK